MDNKSLNKELGQERSLLFEGNLRLHYLFNHLPESIIIINPDFRIIQANNYARDVLYGMIGRQCHNYFGRSHPCPECPATNAFKTAEVEKSLVTGQAKGEEICLEATAIPFAKENQAVSLVAVYIKDITPSIHAQAALTASEKRIIQFIESSPVAIRIAREGRLIYANAAYLNMFGYEHLDEVLGKAIVDFYPPKYQPMIKRWQEDRLAGKDAPVHYQAKAWEKNGDVKEIEKWMTAIEYEGKLSILSFIVDVSESKALKERLRISEKQQALGTLAGGIAHDFNNILFAIIGYAEWAKINTLPDQQEIHYGIDNIIKAGRRAGDMVNQIKEFSQQTEQILEPIRIGQVAKEALELILPSVPANITVHIEIRAENDFILGDATRIHQVIMNLCKNALQAIGGEKGILELNLVSQFMDAKSTADFPDLKPGWHINMMVKDTGHGIPKAVMDRIFDPYFTTKKKEGGTGIGLAVVARIVKNHNGVIHVDSRVGKGTVFTVIFPLIGKTGKKEYPTSTAISGGNETILFVDDDTVITDMARRFLVRLGYQAVVRTNGMDALEVFLARPDRFDLVITDVSMPVMSGEKLVSEILAIRPDVPIIFCTGYCDTNVNAVETLSNVTCLMKPFVMQELAGAIREMLDQGKMALS